MASSQWSPEQARSHWNGRYRALRTFSGAPSTDYYRRCEKRLIREHFGALAGKRFLKSDLWNEARNTEILFWVAEQGAEVSGFDISTELLAQVRMRFEDRRLPATLVQSDIRDIALPADSFDLLYSMGTVEHVPEYQQGFDELFRVLKPGGRAIIGVPNLADPFLRPAVVALLTALGRYPYAPEKAFTYGQLRACLLRAGFVSPQRAGLLLVPGVLRMADLFLWLRAPRLTRLTGALVAPFERLEVALPALARHGYLIACVVDKPA